MTAAASHEDRGLFESDLDGHRDYDAGAFMSVPDEGVSYAPPMPALAASVNDDFVVPAGMPKEVFIDKYARKKPDVSFQTWVERVSEVVEGNFTLDPRLNPQAFAMEAQKARFEYHRDKELTHDLARRGLWVMSGRHLQHGDADQKSKIGDLFMNCTSALFTWAKFWLLMKGSGCSRSYDSDVHFVNWDYLPNCRFILSSQHPDYQDWIESAEEAAHKYDTESDDVRWFDVEDSAEGWAKVLMIMETAAFHKNNTDTTFIFNFTPVRANGEIIKGQQNRPASGPVPLIKALQKVMAIKGLGWKPWKQALFIDHYCSDCIRLGGVRRSARLSCKSWRDKDIIEYIDIKRGGWLWTSNNSIAVDAEFWEQALDPRPSHARRVYEAAISAAFYDQTGEPGFVNVDQITWSNAGADKITVDTYMGDRVKAMFGEIHEKTMEMVDYTLEKAKKKKYPFLPNPCGEEVMAVWGSYCAVGDACLAYAKTTKDAIDAVRMVTQALMRVNLMEFLYTSEVTRTNRIGVSLIGVFEFMWEHFGISIKDAVFHDQTYAKKYPERFAALGADTRGRIKEFWSFLSVLENAVDDEATRLANEWGVEKPHTMTCMKPGGTVPKPLNCTEAANPPAMPHYMRWVQFRQDHPGLQAFADRGYPVRDISKSEVRVNDQGQEYTVNGYPNTCIVGFPTKMRIADIMGENLVTANDLHLDDYFAWLRLLETHWLGGPGKNAQISITIKYDPKKIGFQEFMQTMLEQQKTIRCAAVMPQEDTSSYIYVPEQRISKDEYETFMAGIDKAEREAVEQASMGCVGDRCGLDGSRNASIMDELAATAH